MGDRIGIVILVAVSLASVVLLALALFVRWCRLDRRRPRRAEAALGALFPVGGVSRPPACRPSTAHVKLPACPATRFSVSC